MNLWVHVSCALADGSSHAPIQTDFPLICYGPGQSQQFIWHGAGWIPWLPWHCLTNSQIFSLLSAPSHNSVLRLVSAIKLHPEAFWSVPVDLLEIENEWRVPWFMRISQRKLVKPGQRESFTSTKTLSDLLKKECQFTDPSSFRPMESNVLGCSFIIRQHWTRKTWHFRANVVCTQLKCVQ